jgi:hypothetical protein
MLCQKIGVSFSSVKTVLTGSRVAPRNPTARRARARFLWESRAA